MRRYIGLDVHAASSTLAVVSETGRKLKDYPLETNGRSLVEAIRMIPGQKHLVFEEGTQSAWLYEILSPHVDEAVVAKAATPSERSAYRKPLSSAVIDLHERPSPASPWADQEEVPFPEVRTVPSRRRA